jgi:hypothetical protein
MAQHRGDRSMTSGDGRPGRTGTSEGRRCSRRRRLATATAPRGRRPDREPPAPGRPRRPPARRPVPPARGPRRAARRRRRRPRRRGAPLRPLHRGPLRPVRLDPHPRRHPRRDPDPRLGDPPPAPRPAGHRGRHLALEERLQRTPEDGEIAAELGIDVTTVQERRASASPPRCSPSTARSATTATSPPWPTASRRATRTGCRRPPSSATSWSAPSAPRCPAAGAAPPRPDRAPLRGPAAARHRRRPRRHRGPRLAAAPRGAARPAGLLRHRLRPGPGRAGERPRQARPCGLRGHRAGRHDLAQPAGRRRGTRRRDGVTVQLAEVGHPDATASVSCGCADRGAGVRPQRLVAIGAELTDEDVHAEVISTRLPPTSSPRSSAGCRDPPPGRSCSPTPAPSGSPPSSSATGRSGSSVRATRRPSSAWSRTTGARAPSSPPSSAASATVGPRTDGASTRTRACPTAAASSAASAPSATPGRSRGSSSPASSRNVGTRPYPTRSSRCSAAGSPRR